MDAYILVVTTKHSGVGYPCSCGLIRSIRGSLWVTDSERGSQTQHTTTVPGSVFGGSSLKEVVTR